MYGSQPNYKGLTIDVLKDSDSIDKKMFNKMDGGMPVTEFNALLSITDSGRWFKIDYTQMKPEHCLRFVPKVGSAAEITQVSGITVMGPNQPLDMNVLSTRCYSVKTPTVTFLFW